MEVIMTASARLILIGSLRVEYWIPIKDQIHSFRWVHEIINDRNFPPENTLREINQVGLISFNSDSTVKIKMARHRINKIGLKSLDFRAMLALSHKEELKKELPLSVEVIASPIEIDGVKRIPRFYFDYQGCEIQMPTENGWSASFYPVQIPIGFRPDELLL